VQQLARFHEQEAATPRVRGGKPGVFRCSDLVMRDARAAGKRPEDSHEHVVAKGGERESLCTPSARTRNWDCAEGVTCVQRIGAEVECARGQPARMPVNGT
jgi:hypothetical protein